MTFPSDLRAVARALRGEVSGGQVMCPGPGHSPKDRSLSVHLDNSATSGFRVHSFSGDDWRNCAEHVRTLLGLPRYTAPRRPQKASRPPPVPNPDGDNRHRAIALWRRRKPIAGSLAETYLRAIRKYDGPIPATLGFLPASGKYQPAMIGAYGVATETEPGLLAIRDSDVRAVHLTALTSTAERISKITFGRGAAGAPIVIAPPNDLLGLAITEGIEDAASVHAATGMGAWAAGSAPFMPALAASIPACVAFVRIVADDNVAGYCGARGLAAGLLRRNIPFAVVSLGAAQ
jgi:hypothetical protein